MDTRQVDQALAGLGTRKTQRAPQDPVPQADPAADPDPCAAPGRCHAPFAPSDTESGTANRKPRRNHTINEITFTSASDRCSAWHLQATSDAFTGPGGRPCASSWRRASAAPATACWGMPRASPPPGWTHCSSTYRGFGASGGSPRQLVSVQRQRQDYHAAVAAARKLPGVDPERIVLWGISYSGGHVVVVAARDKRVAATISVTPAMDGIPVLIQLGRNAGPDPPRACGRATDYATRSGRLPAARRISSPWWASRGRTRMVTPASGKETYAAIASPSWRNELCARTALEAGFNRPITFASRVTCPLLVQVGTDDSICPPPAGRRAVTKAGPRAKLREYPIDHLDIYTGAWQERALADELNFLRRCF